MTKIELRDYQKEASIAVMSQLENQESSLVSLATGTGKSLLIADIISKFKEKDKYARIIMSVNNANLVKQNCKELREINPSLDIGLYTTSSNKEPLKHDIIFATIQGLNNLDINEIGYISLIIADECHFISDKDTGMWRKLIKNCKILNPNVKLFGASATIFRNGTGLITQGEFALFKDVCYIYTLADGIRDGYLCPLISKITKNEPDLSSVRMKGFDYNEVDLDILMSNEDRVKKALDEVEILAKDRKAFLYFCSGVNHANMVQKELNRRGKISEIIVAKTNYDKRDIFYDKFKKSELCHLVSVNALSTGTNLPITDCLVMLRPSKSPIYYIQAAGRGTRLHKDKTNCLFLDFAGLIAEHGAVTDVENKLEYNPIKQKHELVMTKKINNTKVCPNCQLVCALKEDFCECGYEFPKFDKLKHGISAAIELDIMGSDNRDIRKVKGITYHKHTSSAGNICIQINYITDKFVKVPDWKTPGKTKYQEQIFISFLMKLVSNTPENNEFLKSKGYNLFNDFLREQDIDKILSCEKIFNIPENILVEKEGNYLKVKAIDYK